METSDLYRDCILDLLVDIRCAYRDGLEDYAIQCELKVLRLATKQPEIGKYGMPI